MRQAEILLLIGREAEREDAIAMGHHLPIVVEAPVVKIGRIDIGIAQGRRLEETAGLPGRRPHSWFLSYPPRLPLPIGTNRPSRDFRAFPCPFYDIGAVVSTITQHLFALCASYCWGNIL